MHLFCNKVVIGRSRSSDVDDFDTNRKRVGYANSLLVRHWNYCAILHHVWHTATYWLTIITCFSYPSIIRQPRSPCSLWNFAVKLTKKKLSSSEDCMIVACHYRAGGSTTVTYWRLPRLDPRAFRSRPLSGPMPRHPRSATGLFRYITFPVAVSHRFSKQKKSF